MADFEFDGRRVPVISQHEMTLSDLAFIKEHFEISGLVDLEVGMSEMDPTAWRAVLIASVRRSQPEISPTHGGIDDVAIMPLIEALNAERAERLSADEEGGDRPTTSTRGRGGSRR